MNCNELLTIGHFARATALSQKALRLYGQLGLLPPASIDPTTGYRSYQAEQVPTARLIRMLREMGMPLATIRLVLAATPAEAGRLVYGFVAELEQRLALAKRIAADVEAYLAKEESMDVQVQSMPEQTVLCVTKRVLIDGLHSTIVDTLTDLEAAAKAQGLTLTGQPFGIYHGPINADEDGPIQVCLPVAGGGSASGSIEATIIPAVTGALVAMRDEQCDYPAILEGYDATIDWIHSQGFKTAGSPRELWHDQSHMDILWPFESK